MAWQALAKRGPWEVLSPCLFFPFFFSSCLFSSFPPESLT